MTTTGLIVLLLVAGAIVLAAWFLVPAWRTFHGTRVITCPDDSSLRTVEIDARHAALTSFGGSPDLKLSSCSRWPEKQDCGQECLQQIESSRDGCLVVSLVSDWYAGKACALCGKPIGAIRWAEHAPALAGPNGETLLWKDVKPEQLSSIFATHRPVCWDCHVVESVVRKHPDRVTVRPERSQLIH